MPEIATDNIAIAVLMAVVTVQIWAIRSLWKSLEASNQREAAALREGIELDRAYASQLEQLTMVMTAIQAGQRSTRTDIRHGFQSMASLLRETVQDALRQVEERIPPYAHVLTQLEGQIRHYDEFIERIDRFLNEGDGNGSDARDDKR